MQTSLKSESVEKAAKNMNVDPNPYVAVPMMVPQCAADATLKTKDDRTIVETLNKSNFLSRIGQLRMTFDLEDTVQTYNGTATAFAYIAKEGGTNAVYAVTCGHNLRCLTVDGAKECSKVVFEVRATVDQSSSRAVVAYEAQKWWIHPAFDPSQSLPKHDLAILRFEDKESYFENLEDSMDGLDVIDNASMDTDDSANVYGIYGFPVQSRGKLCGTSKKAKIKENVDGLLLYDIPTSGGQSGSPIIQPYTDEVEERSVPFVVSLLGGMFVLVMAICSAQGMTLGSAFDAAVFCSIATFIGIGIGEHRYGLQLLPKQTTAKERCRIVGVHTTGNVTGNIGVKLTKETIAWAKSCVGCVADAAYNKEASLYCLEETNFVTPYL